MSAELPFAQPLAVAVDVVVLTVVDGALRVLLTRRKRAPFEGKWSLPGGFVGPDESADEAASRELRAKTGVADIFLEQLYTFSAPRRDPRTRVVSIAYYALVAAERLRDRGGTRESRWSDVGTDDAGRLRIDGRAQGATELAFDHAEILSTALARIRGKLDYAPIGFQLLPAQFTLTEIQQVHEAILGRPIDKRNFRKKMLDSGLVRELDAFRTGAHRPARLYAFVDRTF
ncbi:NUDIX hydrolase [Myxococcota bacterium]|nr:NUDIX hydrolase [Myxococcota bacterium]